MGTVVVPSFGADPVSVTGPTLDAKVDGIATEFNGNIENVNIKAAAAIANSKLNLASVAQDVTLAGTNVLSGATTISGALTQSGIVTMTAKILKEAKGADVASAAGAMTLGDDGNYFDITGTEAITSITAKTAGTIVTLQFDSTATLTDGSNLKLDGNFTGAAGSTITLRSDGTNWYEVCRSPAGITFASAAEVKTGTEAAKVVAPSTMIGHEGVIKGWAKFAPVGGTGAVTAAASYNVSGITDNGTGDFTVSWATDFADANYVVTATAESASDANPLIANVKQGTQAAGSVGIITTYAANKTDPAMVHVMAIGSR